MVVDFYVISDSIYLRNGNILNIIQILNKI